VCCSPTPAPARRRCGWACNRGHGRGGVGGALRRSGADPSTPMAIAKDDDLPHRVTAQGRWECVVALEVRSLLLLCHPWEPLL
jgi:hypothetical protein